jgi:hypothetical protein
MLSYIKFDWETYGFSNCLTLEVGISQGTLNLLQLQQVMGEKVLR